MPYADPIRQREYLKLYHRNEYATNPICRQKQLARALVGHALKSGRIVRQPCEVCGEKVAEAHHDDYAKPLEIRWLCEPHHLAAHGGTKKPRTKPRNAAEV